MLLHTYMCYERELKEPNNEHYKIDLWMQRILDVSIPGNAWAILDLHLLCILVAGIEIGCNCLPR